MFITTHSRGRHTAERYILLQYIFCSLKLKFLEITDHNILFNTLILLIIKTNVQYVLQLLFLKYFLSIENLRLEPIMLSLQCTTLETKGLRNIAPKAEAKQNRTEENVRGRKGKGIVLMSISPFYVEKSDTVLIIGGKGKGRVGRTVNRW